ncbi:flavin reductase family protein [Roseomonas sp. GC11]|uniref:flavin reductase family protein n=1 Tax=Roseomonas sp. GC11 TaxID=2950546 RepID=UPI00210DD354|nr:flavin reductase family protein [Roseomonas sp. GC11]MCQ4162847.1 flavin reductase family protein [Roseomonas sp. GC11]
MTSPPDAPAGVQAAFRAAMRRFASTVTVITAADHARRHGMTATAVTSLSMDPPSLLVCIHRQTLLHDIVMRAPRFCVNVLHPAQIPVSAAFSGGTPPERRFDDEAWQQSAEGVPFLRGAQANLFCRKAAAIPYGTHLILVGEVDQVEQGEITAPLLYHDAGYCIAAPAA